MVMIHKVHSAQLVFCLEWVFWHSLLTLPCNTIMCWCTLFSLLVTDVWGKIISCRDTISGMPLDLDLTNTHQAQKVIDQCYDKYFSLSSIKDSEDSGNTTSYNFHLCLRDLASVVEADQAQRAGDIGRLILMWKQWVLMAQGKSGLTHYSKHLPRLVTLITTTLPTSLAHVVKHSMLLPTGNREDHWVAKDFFLEQINYLLKYFYKNSVSFIIFVFSPSDSPSRQLIFFF